MGNDKTPVLLTTEQIITLQDIILEKQYQLAATQSENEQVADYVGLTEQMSHTTDLLLALASALPGQEQSGQTIRLDVSGSACS
ncbi:MAG: hypothetical protein FH752_02085 [Marinobacter adhaerens]|uniref:Uncharacterized protein n=1 Tax=Marinobacter adhaerens TaxID=1033846 RepID=A0A844HX61_9GAMM|nr:hypothetical protein [Marinobacter adhaerens]